MAGWRCRRGVGRFSQTLLSLVITFLGLLFVTFFIGRVIPIDPVLAVLGDRATQAQVEAMRHTLGLDRPMIEQFLIYVGDVLTGDFGTSLLTAHPVIDDIRRVFPATLELATLGDASSASCSASRRASLAAVNQRAVASTSWCASSGWSAIPCRSSGSGWSALLVFYGQLDWVGRPGPARRLLRVIYDLDVTHGTGSILIDSLLAGAWDVSSGNALSPHHPAGLAARLFLARLHLAA